jgi:hypothetical protein
MARGSGPDFHAGVAPGGVEPPRTDSKSVALSAELRGRAPQRSGVSEEEMRTQNSAETGTAEPFREVGRCSSAIGKRGVSGK